MRSESVELRNWPTKPLADCIEKMRVPAKIPRRSFPYANAVVPALETFKFKHFGHDVVVLHETEIRKERGTFPFSNRAHKNALLDELTGIIKANNFILIACIVDKARLRERNENPYHAPKKRKAPVISPRP